MTATQQTPEQILGYLARLGNDPQITAWQPGSLAIVKAMAPPPAPQPRGWKIEPVLETQLVPPVNEAPSPVPPPAPVPVRPELPENLQEASVQDIILARPEDAAKLVRTIRLGEQGYEQVDADDISPMNKLAILFIGLGQKISGEVLKYLTDYEIEDLTQSIANVKTVSQEMQQQILGEFKDLLIAGEWVALGGLDFARGALELAVGPSKAQEILDRVASTVSSGFYMLKDVTPEQVAPFISNEHPQTIALILSQLDPHQSAGILSHLPEKLQGDVAYRITTMENITPAVLKEIEESLEQNLRDVLGGNQDVGGPKVVADILNLTGSSVEKNVLDHLDATDAESGEWVRNLMFVFADIAKLTDRDIQVLLKEVNQKDLVVALKAAQEEIKERLLNNLSKEARKTITDEMEFIGPMRLSEVEEVQLRIVQQVRALEEQGKVTIIRGDSDDTLV